MKSNWQTITMLVVAAILTFIVVSSMNNYLNSKKRQELSYNEFVQMVEAGEVDSIKVGSTEITVIPKKGNTKYSQNLDYYVVRLEGIMISSTGYWIITWLPTVRRATAAPFFWSC